MNLFNILLKDLPLIFMCKAVRQKLLDLLQTFTRFTLARTVCSKNITGKSTTTLDTLQKTECTPMSVNKLMYTIFISGIRTSLQRNTLTTIKQESND